MPPKPETVTIGANEILRFLLELVAIATICFWGFALWPAPWLNWVMGIAAPLLAAIVWGLFRSPKAPVHLGPSWRAVVEICVMGAATVAWFALGQPIIGIAFAVLALVSGALNLKKEIAREATE